MRGDQANGRALTGIFNSNDKPTAAQKRARQRDSRRYEENPYRTMEEELAERRRKREQAERRGRPESNPRDERFGDRYFREKREVDRYVTCKQYEEGCDYISDAETYSRLYRADRLADRIVQDRAFRRNYRNVRNLDIYGLDLDDCEDLCDDAFDLLLDDWTEVEHEDCLDACDLYWDLDVNDVRAARRARRARRRYAIDSWDD